MILVHIQTNNSNYNYLYCSLMFELKFTIKKTGARKKPRVLSPNNLGIKLLSKQNCPVMFRSH